MKVVAWMTIASLLSWAIVAVAADGSTSAAVLAGMLGPLVIATTSWLAADRAYRRDPSSLTGVMITAFGAKMVFFAGYVTFVLKGLSELPVRPVPFVVSFTAYFIALHLVEALSLRRLFAS
jgi:hypothetical protein